MIYHNYLFFSVRPSFYDLPQSKQENYKKSFIKEMQKEKKVITYPYATLGLKATTTFLLWFQADSIEEIQNNLNNLMHTEMGKYLKITYTLFGIIRRTQYSSSTSKHLDAGRKGGAYLIIYPF